MTTLLAAGAMTMFISQLLGFGLLVALLYKFVWGHLVSGLRQRREGIQAIFDGIERETAEILQSTDAMRRKLEGVDAEARERFDRALAEGRTMRDALLAEARASAKVEAGRVAREISHEGDKAVVELRHHVVNKVLAATEQCVRASMGPELQERIVERTLGDLERLAP